MKIGALVHMYPWHHNAGAEHMLHSMLLYAVEKGHSATVVIEGANGEKPEVEPYVLDGVKVSTDRRALKGIDILLTHLDRTPEAETMATQRDIPLVQIFHNHQRPAMTEKCDLGIFNTQHLLEDSETPPFPYRSVVLHPPIWPERYRVERTGDKITLINLQQAKGVEMFYCLAEQMPHLQFLGVKGSYGHQLMPQRDLPNLTIIENQTDVRKVYAQTKILLMPSSYESYGRVAVEAAVSGIPTIAHRTKGLWEALGEAGNFPLPDSDSWKAAVNFVLETYPTRSILASQLGASLDPAGDMDRCLAAMEQTVADYA